MRKNLWRVAAAAVTGLLAAGGVAAAAAMSPASAGSWAWCSSDPSGYWASGGLALYNNMWNSGAGPQTICGNSGSDWQATSDQPAGNTGVLTYPDVQYNFASPYPLVSGLDPASTSSFTETMNANPGTSAEAGYDIWLNTPSGGTRDEVMIWNDTVNRGTVGGSSYRASAVFGGVTWQLWNYGPELIWYLPQNEQSGIVYWAQMLQWLQAHGYLNAGDTMSQFEYGWEICSTGGQAENFDVTAYSFTLNGVTYGTGPSPSPSPSQASPSPSGSPPAPSPSPSSSSPAPPGGVAEKVTASVTNGWPGFGLRVLALDGARESGGAGASGQATSGVAQAVLTPQASGSYPVFGLASGSTATTYTALAGNSFYDNVADTAEAWSFADGRYAGPVTAGRDITAGSSAPPGQDQAWAAYEVPPSGSAAPAADPASPAGVSTESSSAATAGFTAPHGAVLVAIAEANGMGSGPDLGFSLADTAGLHWTLREVTHADNEGVAIWTATVP